MEPKLTPTKVVTATAVTNTFRLKRKEDIHGCSLVRPSIRCGLTLHLMIQLEVKVTIYQERNDPKARDVECIGRV